jgi:hypothetical protein
MRKTNIVIGAIFLIFPFFFLPAHRRELEVQEHGQLVKMRIVDIPGSCLGTKVKWFMKVEWEGVVYPIQISGNYCEEHSVGDLVEMKYLKGNDNVLFPDENVWNQMYGSLFSFFAGLFAIVYYGFFYKEPLIVPKKIVRKGKKR